jgi:hypothetical protein
MSNEPIMTKTQRALQVWPLLVLAAKTQTVLSYAMVAQMTGLPNECGDVLGYIAFYCMQRKLPILPSLVVNQQTGRPSAEFYENMDIAAEQSRCFVYNWLEHGVPSLQQLEDAYRAGRSAAA